MNSDSSVSQFAKVLPELFENKQTVTFCPSGISMLPTIRKGDSVTLVKPYDLKKYDIVLYLREDGKAVLHRIVGYDKSGGYIMCGDSQTALEYGIKDKNIVAKVISFTHGSKIVTTGSFPYKIKTALVLVIRFLRRVKRKLKRIVKVR